jgi:membrane protease YdiL (CAAX protease family)
VLPVLEPPGRFHPPISWRAAIFDFGARVPVAIALTWLYVRRRSILASGTLHAGYNGAMTLVSFLAS